MHKAVAFKVRATRSLMRRLEKKSPGLALRISSAAANDHEIRTRTARILEANGAASDALNYLTGLPGATEDAACQLLIAHYAERAKDYPQATQAYERAIALGEDQAQTYFRLASCLRQLGCDVQALKQARRAAELAPSDQRIQELIYALSGEAPGWKKHEILATGLHGHQESVAWRRQLAESAFAMKRWHEAAEHYSWCSAQPGTVDDALFAGLSYSRMGQLTQARAQWATAVARSGKPEVSSLGVGALLQAKGLWREAAAEYRHHLAQGNDRNAALVYSLGIVLLRQYQWEEAVSFLRRATQLDPKNKQYWYYCGIALDGMGRHGDAAVAYISAIDSKHPLAFRRYRAVYSLHKSGDFEGAAQLLPHVGAAATASPTGLAWSVEGIAADLAAAVRRSDAVGCRAAADAALAVGNYELAESALRAAEARESTHDPSLYLAWSSALLKLGRTVDAIQVYLRSRMFGNPHGLNAEDYLKGKQQRDAAVYLDYQLTREVDDSLVLYESNHGGAITCSVRPVLERMLTTERGRAMTHIVVINDRDKVPSSLLGFENVIFVPKESDAYKRYLATSGWLVSNNTFPPYFSRRSQQRYLNMWHGTPMKTLGKDIKSGEMDHRNATRNFLHVTHFAMPNEFTGQVLLERYDVARIFPGKCAVTGSPRMDISLRLSADRKAEIRRRLGATGSDRVVLLAPTWRGSLADKKVDVEQLREDLAAMAGDGVVVAFRGHPLMEQGLAGLQTDAVVVPSDIDTNELIAAVDVLVSDYSSIAIDSVGAGVRTLLYVYDLEHYQEERGLYMDLTELPVEVVATRDELAAALQDLDRGVPTELGKFAEMWAAEDGSATDRVIDFFFEGTELPEASRSPRRDHEAVFFEGHFIPNGVTASARQLNRYLDELGIGVTVSVQPKDVVKDQERLRLFRAQADSVYALPHVGVPLFTPEEIWLNRYFIRHDALGSPEQVMRLQEAYRREYRRLYGYAEFDSAVCFEGYSRYWACVLGAAPEGVNKVIYQHSDMLVERQLRFPYLDGVFQIYHWFDSLVSVTNSARQTNQVKLGDVAPADRFVYAENLVDTAEIEALSQEPLPSAATEFIERCGGSIYINVGRMTPQKNHAALLEAFARLGDRRSGLILVGDGPLSAELESRAVSLGIADQVFFAGFQPNPYPFVAASDVFVMSSAYEGQGIVILEAICLGKPVVSVDIPGPRSILRHGGGLLVPESVSGLVDGMRQIVAGAAYPPFDLDRYLVEAGQRHLRVLGLA